jgi:hypothetical protein
MTTSTKTVTSAQFEELKNWVEATDPDVEAINRRADAERAAPVK